MSQTKQNFNFFQSQKHFFEKLFSLFNRSVVGFHNQHNKIKRRLFNSLPQNKFLGLGKTVGINVNLFDKLKRFLKNYQMIIASHYFYNNIKWGKAATNYQNGGVVKRGGNWDNTTAAGVFARNNNWATNGNTNNGARLARYLFKSGPDFLQLRLQKPRPKNTVDFSPAPLHWFNRRRGVKIKIVITIVVFILLLPLLVVKAPKPRFAHAFEKQASASAIISFFEKEIQDITVTNASISAKLKDIKKDVNKISNDVKNILGKNNTYAKCCPQLIADAHTIGLWHLSTDDNVLDTIIDYSGNKNNGKLISKKSNNPPALKKAGKALKFDKDSYVKIANSFDLNPAQITIEACYYRSGQKGGPIIQKAYITHNPPYYQYFLREDGFAAVSVNGSYVYLDTPRGWPKANQWIYAVLVFDGKHLKTYANGKLMSQIEAVGFLDSYDTELLLGKYRNYDGSFNGLISELRISGIARSGEEIQQIYETAETLQINTESEEQNRENQKPAEENFTSEEDYTSEVKKSDDATPSSQISLDESSLATPSGEASLAESRRASPSGEIYAD